MSRYYGTKDERGTDPYLMNVTLLRWTVETALSSQVVSSGQYTTYVCSSDSRCECADDVQSRS